MQVIHKIKNSVFEGSIVILVMAFVLPFFFAPDTSAATLTLSLDSSSLSLLTTPTSSDGTFASSSNLGISVTLNGLGGYLLSIRASSSAASARTLINSTANTALTSITSAVSPTNYADSTYALANNLNNTWGYLPSKFNSAANTDFHPAPTVNGDIIDETSEAGNNTAVNYTISIGARVDTTTKPGTYSNAFVIVAVANRPECNPTTTTIDTAVCMQDMNDRVINSMEPEVQYQLYDNRDYKKYYVAKMKDGRVWMTQNLDLDLISDINASNYVALTSENTDLTTFGSQNYTSGDNGYKCTDSGGNDITSTTSNNCTSAGDVISWVPATATLANNAYASWTSSSTAPVSWDGGDYYFYTSGSTSSDSNWTMQQCATSGRTEAECKHYHVGNYYNWTAAVASNSTSNLKTDTTVMGNSICPAGWRLSKGRTTTTATETGYYSEINYTWVAEGLATNYVTSSTTGADYTANGLNSIRTAPMYMTRAGYRSGTGSSVTRQGSYGDYWTSTISGTNYAYAPYFTSSNLYPLYSTSTYAYAYRRNGESVRCVAKQNNTGSTVITFNKNADDATGTTSNQTISANSFGNISNNSFVRSGYAFNSWNTEPDGSGITYTEGAKYYAITGTSTTNVTLYAQWDKAYTITFKTADANATGIYFDGVRYTNNQTAQAFEGRNYTIGGDYVTKYGFSSWTITAGTLANSTYPSTTFTMPSSNTTITLASQEATVDMSSLPISTDPVSSDCKNQTPTPILVYDPRDNEAYYVARLCDGNYWMLDNLRLDLTDSAVINSLSESNTNASNTALGYLKNGGGTASDKYAITGLSGSNWNSSSYSFSEPRVNVGGNAVADNGSEWVGSYTKDTVASTTYGQGLGKVGVYYNYCAASAGTFCYGDGSSGTGTPTTDPNTTVAPTARDIEGDICPKGWRMPTGGEYNSVTGGGELQNLYDKYSGATSGQIVAFRNALSTAFSGSYYSGSVHSHGTSADIWSSTWYREQYNYDMVVGTANALPTIMTSVPSGVSVRCMRYDSVSITVNFDSGTRGVTFMGIDNPSRIEVSTSGSVIILERGKSYAIGGDYVVKHGFSSWMATAGTIADQRPVATYTTNSNATLTLSSQEATTNISAISSSGNTPSSNCKNEPPTPQLVYDPRDNEAYWVAELCDGKVWMLDNLRLDLTNSTVINALSTSNTNASSTALNYLKNGGGTTSDKWPTSGLSGSNWTSSQSYSQPLVNISGVISASSTNPWSGPYNKDSINPVSYGLGSGKIGVHYNYCAASAGTYCWGNGTSSTGAPTSDPNTSSAPTARDIEGDICPRGWHLPTGGKYNATTGGGDFAYLYSMYQGATLGVNTAFYSALSTQQSGPYYSGGLSSDAGYYWSSTWNSSNGMCGLRVGYNGMLLTENAYTSFYGNSVRCVRDS